MGVASGCDEQEAGVASGSGWNLWVWLESMGVATGCGCKEVYRSSYYLSLLLLYLFFFAAASLLFVHLKKCFSFFIIYNNCIHSTEGTS